MTSQIQRLALLARAYAVAILVMASGILVTLALASWLFAEAQRIDAERFEASVQRLVDHLDERTERYAQDLDRFADRVSAQPEISEESWRHEVDRLGPVGNLPALIELSYAGNTGALSPAEMEVIARAPRTNSIGDLILPRLHLAPQRVERQWAGLPSVSAEQTTAWLEETNTRAHWTITVNGKMSSSPKRVMPGSGGPPISSVSFFYPIFESDVIALTKKYPHIQYRHFLDYRFRGLVIGTIGWERFLETALSGDLGRMGFEAFASTNVNAEAWMNSGNLEKPRTLEAGFNPTLIRKVEWPFFRHSWTLVFYSTEKFDELSQKFRGWIALIAGFAITGLMSALLAVQTRARRGQEIISGDLKRALTDLSAARREREHLNHDLHDGTIQSLYGLQLGLSRSVEIADDCSRSLGVRMKDHWRALTGIIGELRGFILRHEVESGPTADLAGVLEALVQRLRLSTGSALQLEISRPTVLRLEPEQAVHLANLSREALSNALRHSHASVVKISFRGVGDSATLEISDNGCGFDPVNSSSKGVGLTSMAVRAREAGGRLEIESKPDLGTTVHVKLSLRRPIAQEHAK